MFSWIMTDIMCCVKQTIPVKIGMYFEALIGKVIQLKRPSGDTWHIGLIWTGEELALQSGWNQFVVANDISQNDFVVFKFIGGSKFEVLIFDPNGYEKSSNVGKKMRNGLVQVFAFGAEPIRSKPDNYNKRFNEIEVFGNTIEDVQGSSTGGMSESETLSLNLSEISAMDFTNMLDNKKFEINAGNYFHGNQQLSFGVQGQNPSFRQVLKPSSLTIQCGVVSSIFYLFILIDSNLCFFYL
jgi:B3 DNA binding domain